MAPPICVVAAADIAKPAVMASLSRSGLAAPPVGPDAVGGLSGPDPVTSGSTDSVPPALSLGVVRFSVRSCPNREGLAAPRAAIPLSTPPAVLALVVTARPVDGLAITARRA